MMYMYAFALSFSPVVSHDNLKVLPHFFFEQYIMFPQHTLHSDDTTTINILFFP